MSEKNKFKLDKSKLAISITIFIICFIIVYVMCIQFKTVDKIDVAEIETMRENDLREALANWKEQYQETDKELKTNEERINEYQNRIESDEEAGELLQDELENAKMLLGLTNVHGTGIIITFTDNNDKYILSEDLLKLINELNSAGAEAISINNERIVSMTDIVDVGEFIVINNKRITSPYTIKAIGDLTYLQSALSIKNGFLDEYQTNGYTISMKTDNDVVIDKYEGKMTLDYVK